MQVPEHEISQSLCAGCAALTVACLPRRLWWAQLGRLGLLTGGIFLLTALSADGIPPVIRVRV